MAAVRALTYPLRLGDGVTRVLDAGAEDAPCVLFLHGLGARADRWARNFEAIAAAGLRALAVDLPGHGLASKGTGLSYTADAVAHDLAELLGSEGQARVRAVGTSLGALIAMRLALLRPELVSHLVLVGSLGLEPLTDEQKRAMAASVVNTSREGIAAKLTRVLADPALITPEWVAEEWRINNSPGAAASLAAWAAYIQTSINGDVSLAAIDDLGIPVRLVWGSEDRVVPLAVGQRAARVLNKAELKIIEGAGHVPYLEQPASFHSAVTGFLTSGS
jgi:2-hydroxy-6-oxonona-2,4-dienedioate hydrolase